MKILVELSGGLELLFDNSKTIDIDTDILGIVTVKDLIGLLEHDYIKANPELFSEGDHL